MSAYLETECLRHAARMAGTLQSYPGVTDKGSDGYTFRFTLPTGETELETTEMNFLESAYCALTHTDPLIAFRAYSQAARYLGRMDGHRPTYALRDALDVAKNRIEAFLRPS